MFLLFTEKGQCRCREEEHTSHSRLSRGTHHHRRRWEQKSASHWRPQLEVTITEEGKKEKKKGQLYKQSAWLRLPSLNGTFGAGLV